ncbi:MAG: EAL domain-containing protein [Desulfovibrionales bacterium]|nr:EAL domain-containing protein [Desulfovibrionales bacterium]
MADAPTSAKSTTPHRAAKIFPLESAARELAVQSPLWEFWYAPDGTLEVVSESCERCCGYEPAHFYTNSRFMEAIMLEEYLSKWHTAWEDLHGGASYVSTEFQIRLPDGKKRWIQFEGIRAEDAKKKFCGIRCICHDITAHRNVLQQLTHFSWHDSLTKLPNRSKCLEKIEDAIQRAKQTGSWDFSVAYLDILRFTNINDSFGHAAGDAVLCKLADRLRSNTSGFESIFRIGGDEFVIVFEDISTQDSVHNILNHIRKRIKRPIIWKNKQLHITPSFGVMHGSPDVGSGEKYLQNAHAALNHGRDVGLDDISVYDHQRFSKALKLISMELDLHNALIHEEFFLLFQPVLDTEHRTITGFEALVRWNNRQGHIISPNKFIPVAEESGLILSLGEWVLRNACLTLSAWRAQYPAFQDLKVNVNLSARQLSDLELTDTVSRILEETKLPPHCLQLEVTETMLMENPDYADITLRRLKALGIGICIDDFGTGYSSLVYLQQFPISTLKIDRSFVSDMENNHANYKIVIAVVALAHSLGLTVVAEGVEEEEQRIMLVETGCDSAQGFLFSQPIVPEEIPPLVHSFNNVPDATLNAG